MLLLPEAQNENKSIPDWVLTFGRVEGFFLCDLLHFNIKFNGFFYKTYCCAT